MATATVMGTETTIDFAAHCHGKLEQVVELVAAAGHISFVLFAFLDLSIQRPDRDPST